MPHQFLSLIIRMPFFFRILLMAIFLICTFGAIIYLVEPYTFTTLFDGIWWAIITASTVGYGDFVPKTIVGKLIGIFLIFIGAGILSSYFVTLASAAVKRQTDYMEGKIMYKGKDHFMIIGWNERSRAIIEKLIAHGHDHSIVLIDQSLKSSPYTDHHVHFIQGRANLDEILMKANIFEAKKVLITADQNNDELHADMNSILTLIAIKGLNPSVPCIVEILTSEQVANAKRAGANEVIQSNIITSSVMINCLHSTGMVESLMILLEQFNGTRFSFRSSTSYVGKDFIEANQQLLAKGKLLFGIKRGTETFVNPPHHFTIKEHDILLVITEPEQ